MLILTRKNNERILIGDDIAITVLSINDHSVVIGVDAPKDVIIDREEVRHRRESGWKE